MAARESGGEEARTTLEASHTPSAIRARLAAGPTYSYVRDFVYGGIDGVVTTFAIVAGSTGAELSSGIVVVLGLANLVADGLSMAVSNFLGTQAEGQLRERVRRTEAHHVKHHPEGEREEVRQIFAAKGFEGRDLDRVVDVITADRERWIGTMVAEEFGIGSAEASAWRAGVATFVAFVGAGALPLLAYLGELLVPGRIERPFLWSALLASAGFVAIGALKGRVVGRTALVSGAETLLVGGLAAVAAYAIGHALESLAGS
jgi:VIT1/CCC1 family predicted Fe2+/Mn2+ transporter